MKCGDTFLMNDTDGGVSSFQIVSMEDKEGLPTIICEKEDVGKVYIVDAKGEVFSVSVSEDSDLERITIN